MKKITREELDQILQQHHLWVYTAGADGKRADLRHIDLCYANLHGADLRHIDLQEADLQYADLRYADLNDANLQEVNLQGADLQSVSLWYADLRDARFGVNIRDCRSFYGAQFTSDAIPWLILHPRWSEWKDSVQIEHT